MRVPGVARDRENTLTVALVAAPGLSAPASSSARTACRET